MREYDLVNFARLIANSATSMGISPPRVVISNYDEWLRMCVAVSTNYLYPNKPKIETHPLLQRIEIYGIVFTYGGEWPRLEDNSDVR